MEVEECIDVDDKEAVPRKVLRILLSLAGLMVFLRCCELFFLSYHAKSGVIILCARQMFAELLFTWLPPMLWSRVRLALEWQCTIVCPVSGVPTKCSARHIARMP